MKNGLVFLFSWDPEASYEFNISSLQCHSHEICLENGLYEYDFGPNECFKFFFEIGLEAARNLIP